MSKEVIHAGSALPRSPGRKGVGGTVSVEIATEIGAFWELRVVKGSPELASCRIPSLNPSAWRCTMLGSGGIFKVS